MPSCPSPVPVLPLRRPAWLLPVALALLAPATAARAQDLSPQARAQTCFACHGPEGRSATPEVPSIAGQPREFLAKQLHLFHDGKRVDAQMAPNAVGLTDADIDGLAAYFSKVTPAPPETPASAAQIAAAEPLVESRHCAACHGDKLVGQLQAPRLAGQQNDYLAWQLRAYRDGKRADPDATMRDAVKGLTNREIHVLADYMSGLDAH